MLHLALQAAAAAVAPGRYAVGVSGGADSVALLHLLHNHRPDLHLHVVHLDHQTRGAESTGDARFVRDLASAWELPLTLALREQIEPSLKNPPANTSAFYRACRHELFRRVVAQHNLEGVLLAHHADDQAETILHRLLRGSAAAGLAGMASETRLGDLRVLRPLLKVPGGLLREYLLGVGQGWREDASNQSVTYFRNRLRQLLGRHPGLIGGLLELNEGLGELRNWVREAAPELPETFPARTLADLPEILAQESARRWLLARGVPAGQLTPPAIAQLVRMATDAASPRRQHFPGRRLIRRKRGMIFPDLLAGGGREVGGGLG